MDNVERDEKSLFEPCSKVFVMIAQRERKRDRMRLHLGECVVE